MRGHIALEVGDLFGPLVNEKRDELDIGVIALDAVGDVLQQNRLARLGRRNDESAGAEADGAEQIDEPTSWRATLVFKGDARLRVERGEFSEGLVAAILRRREPFDRHDARDGGPCLARAVALFSGPHDRGLGDNALCMAQRKMLCERKRHIDIVVRLDQAVAKLADAAIIVARPFENALAGEGWQVLLVGRIAVHPIFWSVKVIALFARVGGKVLRRAALLLLVVLALLLLLMLSLLTTAMLVLALLVLILVLALLILVLLALLVGLLLLLLLLTLATLRLLLTLLSLLVELLLLRLRVGIVWIATATTTPPPPPAPASLTTAVTRNSLVARGTAGETILALLLLRLLGLRIMMWRMIRLMIRLMI